MVCTLYRLSLATLKEALEVLKPSLLPTATPKAGRLELDGVLLPPLGGECMLAICWFRACALLLVSSAARVGGCVEGEFCIRGCSYDEVSI